VHTPSSSPTRGRNRSGQQYQELWSIQNSLCRSIMVCRRVPYTLLGEVTTAKGQTWLWSDAESEAMEEAANEAKKRRADAIIVTRREASVSGYTSSGTATVVGNTAIGTGVTMPVQTGHVRVTAIKWRRQRSCRVPCGCRGWHRRRRPIPTCGLPAPELELHKGSQRLRS
jgi:hypothetical protein